MSIAFEFHETLPSTSTRVQEELRGGRKPPFAIAARVQTAGRGRRGNAWQSHAGNLHLSLALVPTGVALREAGLIPLYVAYLVASWVRERFGLRLTVKWPNDLLFAGRKMGGVLCEGTTAGEGWNELVVGIGLNLRAAPELAENQEAIALSALVEDQPTVERATEELATFFHEHWQSAELARAPELLAGFALEVGQPWREDVLMWRLQSVRADGAMILSGPHERILTSVDHGVRWAYQEPRRESVAVVECGNRRWKAMAWDAKDKVILDVVGSYEDKGWDVFERLARPHLAKVPAIFIGGVNPDGQARLRQRAELPWVEVAKRPLRLAKSAYDLQKIGFDRLAGMEGALRLFPRHPLIVVSAGSALTVDVVDEHRHHRGGWILPGLGMRLAALHAHTKLLPLLSPDEAAATWGDDERMPLGLDTRLAIARGVGAELQSFLQSLAARFPGAAKSAHFVLTGGDAHDLARLVPDALVQSDLILLGMREMALGGSLPV